MNAIIIGYEPSDLTVYTPPPSHPRAILRVGSFFFVLMSSALKKYPQKSLNISGVIQVKRPKNVFFSAYSLIPNFDKLNIIS